MAVIYLTSVSNRRRSWDVDIAMDEFREQQKEQQVHTI